MTTIVTPHPTPPVLRHALLQAISQQPMSTRARLLDCLGGAITIDHAGTEIRHLAVGYRSCPDCDGVIDDTYPCNCLATVAALGAGR